VCVSVCVMFQTLCPRPLPPLLWGVGGDSLSPPPPFSLSLSLRQMNGMGYEEDKGTGVKRIIYTDSPRKLTTHSDAVAGSTPGIPSGRSMCVCVCVSGGGGRLSDAVIVLLPTLLLEVWAVTDGQRQEA
jgi:hypothetical protein